MSDEANTTPAPAPEIAPQKPGIIERIATALDRALAAPVKRNGWERTCWMILDANGGALGQIVTKDELAKLSDWQRQWDRALKATESFGHESAKREFAKHQADLGAAIQSESIGTTTGRPFETIATEQVAKQDAAKQEMIRIHRESGELAMQIGGRFCRLADKFIAGKEAFEKHQHESFGISYRPSALILALKEARTMAWKRSEPIEFGNLPPKMMLPYLDF
jgi:hypothetical protein